MEQRKLLATYYLKEIPKPNIKPPGAEHKLHLLQGGQKGLGDVIRVTKTNMLFFICILLLLHSCLYRANPVIIVVALQASDQAIIH